VRNTWHTPHSAPNAPVPPKKDPTHTATLQVTGSLLKQVCRNGRRGKRTWTDLEAWTPAGTRHSSCSSLRAAELTALRLSRYHALSHAALFVVSALPLTLRYTLARGHDVCITRVARVPTMSSQARSYRLNVTRLPHSSLTHIPTTYTCSAAHAPLCAGKVLTFTYRARTRGTAPCMCHRLVAIRTSTHASTHTSTHKSIGMRSSRSERVGV
jgi:hypothetical protein